MTYASPQDVADELGRPIPTDPVEIAQITRWLGRAENMIRGRIPDLDTQATDAAFAALVVDVEAAAVARRVQNPEGLRSVTKTIDDGTMTKVRDQVLSDGQLRILDEEWDLLLPASSPDALSTRMSYTPGWRHDHLTHWGRP